MQSYNVVRPLASGRELVNWTEQEEDSDRMEPYRIWEGGCRVWRWGEGRWLSQERVVCFLPKIQLGWCSCKHLPFKQWETDPHISKSSTWPASPWVRMNMGAALTSAPPHP